MNLNNRISPPSRGSNNSQQLISVREVLHIIRQRWMLGAAAGICAGAVLAAVLLNQTPSYEAEASMLVELNPDRVVNVEEVVETRLQNRGLLETAMNTHAERLRTRSMAGMVNEALDESQRDALILSFAGPPAERDPDMGPPDPVSYLKKHALKVSWVPDSQILRVKVKLSDPVLAKEIANLYVEEYIRYQMSKRSSATDQAVVFLDEQIEGLRKRLEAGEQALQDYRRKNNIISIEQNQSIIADKLEALSSALTQARIRLLNADSRLKQIEAAGDDLDSLMNIPYVGGRREVSAIYSQLESLRTERAVLGDTFLDKHPRMVENQRNIDSVEDSLWHAIRQASEVVHVERQTILDEIRNLKGELAQAEAEALELDQLAIDDRVLARKVEAERQTFDMLASRYNETTLTQQMQLSTLRTLEMAETPHTPVWPNVQKIALASVFACGIFMVGLPLGLEFLDQRLRSFSDIEGFLGLPVLGGIRHRRRRNEQQLARAVLSRDEDLIEPFRGIYSSLRLKLGSTTEHPLSLVVTSSLAGEGKTFVACNLAQAYASHRIRTILVDCDLRRPSLHRSLGLRNENGIIRWLRSEEPLGECLQDDPNLGIQSVANSESLFFMGTGGSTKEATEVLEDARMNQLVARLKEEFDLVILDTPPVGLFPDATVVADYADHCVFVARQNCVTRTKARFAVGLMERSGTPVAGVVFNGIRNANAARGHGSQGGQAYGYSFADGYEKNTAKYRKYYAQAR